jgi:broad specificity phosphatase PhoE
MHPLGAFPDLAIADTTIAQAAMKMWNTTKSCHELSDILKGCTTFRKQLGGCTGILLIEHGKTNEDVRKLKKGGLTLHQQAGQKLLMNRRGWSSERIIQGVGSGALPMGDFGLDSHLSEDGIREAEHLGDTVKTLIDEGQIISPLARRDYLPFTSTQERTKQTAFHAGWNASHELPELDERINLPFHLRTKPQLQDQQPDLLANQSRGAELEGPGIEPLPHFIDRTRSALLKMLFEYDTHRKNDRLWIPVVTHQSNIKVTIANILAGHPSPWGFEIENCSITPLLLRRRKMSVLEQAYYADIRETQEELRTCFDRRRFKVWDHMPNWVPFDPNAMFEGVPVLPYITYDAHLKIKTG